MLTVNFTNTITQGQQGDAVRGRGEGRGAGNWQDEKETPRLREQRVSGERNV